MQDWEKITEGTLFAKGKWYLLKRTSNSGAIEYFTAQADEDGFMIPSEFDCWYQDYTYFDCFIRID